MKADLRFEFLVTNDGRALTIHREFDAKRQLVWDCHTKAELLDQWFAPKPLITKTKHMDFRPGGYWHFAMLTPDGQTYWSRFDYQTIDPIDRYTALDGFSDESGGINPDMPRSNMNVSFVDQGERTLVTSVVLYASVDDLQKAVGMGMKEGITSTQGRLDELLERLR